MKEIIKDFELPKFCYSSAILVSCLQDSRNSILDIFQKLPTSMWNEPAHGASPMWLLNNLAYYQEEYLLRPIGELALEPRFEYDHYKNSKKEINQFLEIDFDKTWNHLKSLNQLIENYLDSKVADFTDTRLVLNAVFFEFL